MAPSTSLSASLTALEADAMREKERQVYNPTLGSISFILVVLLALLLPSPSNVLSGQWSASILASGLACIGHVVLLVATICAIRCVQVQFSALWQQLQSPMYKAQAPSRPQSTPSISNVAETVQELVNLPSLTNTLSPVRKSLASSTSTTTKRRSLHKRSFFDPEPVKTEQDGQALVRDLAAKEQSRLESEQQSQAFQSSPFGASAASTDPFGLDYGTSTAARVYQATPYDPSLYATSRRKRKDEDALSTVSDPQVAWRQLEESGLQMFMHLYCRNVRRLLACHIKDMVEAFIQNVSELNDCGVMTDLLLRRRATQALLCPPGDPTNPQLTNVTLADLLQQLARSPAFVSKTRNVWLLEEHRSFEKYLNVGDPSTPAYASLERQQYVLERLLVLSKDRTLDRFRWNKGASTWKGSEWTAALPTDAEILMNVFCCLLDNLLPAENERDRPFYKNFMLTQPPRFPLATGGTKASSLRRRLYLVQTKATPPHFKVLVRGAVREIVPGEENCFHAIVVFLDAVKKTKAGYLESINLHRVLEPVFEVSK